MKTGEFFQSSYLRASDLKNPVTVIIDDVTREEVGTDDERKTRPVVHFKGAKKALCLNSTNQRLLEGIFGTDESDAWIGKKIVVYNDPTVMFGNVRTGAVRIRSVEAPKPVPQSDPNEDADTPF